MFKTDPSTVLCNRKYALKEPEYQDSSIDLAALCFLIVVYYIDINVQTKTQKTFQLIFVS